MYDNSDGNSQNWTNRAGSFLEQSRAFLDSYLSRWDRSNEERGDEDTIDDCTSGATSGEDVWGTPTSGENDEIQMFNSDQTNSVRKIKWRSIRLMVNVYVNYILVTHKIIIFFNW